MLLKYSFLFVLFILCVQTQKQLKNVDECDLFVTSEGSDQNDCSSQYSACQTINRAIDVSADDNTICTNGSKIEMGSPTFINKPIRIITLYHEKTIIDGGGLECFYFYRTTHRFEIDGFIITNCSTENKGAAFNFAECYVSDPSDIHLKNLIIEGNTADQGAGMYIQLCNLTLENVVIKNNYATQGGGGLYCYIQNTLQVAHIIATNVIVVDNEAGSGTNNIRELHFYNGYVINNGGILKNCDECWNGGSCNLESGSCDCLPGSVLPSPECELCVEGSFSQFVNSDICQPCLHGEYNDLNGQSECKLCVKGTYNPHQGSTSVDDCLKCEKGTYQNLDGQPICNKCERGSYQNKEGQTQCEMCTMGNYQDLEGQSICEKCREGTFQDLDGQSFCNLCNKGEYNIQTGQSKCKLCVVGTYNPHQGSTSVDDCLMCEKGTYQNLDGQPICNKCERGSYQNKEGQTQCEMCTMGNYQDLEGTSICEKCREGTYQSFLGQSFCFNCVMGTYQELDGQSECKKCQNGTYNPHQGSKSISDCLKCERGTYQDLDGQSFCNLCTKGEYNNQIGQSECKKCQVGTYNKNKGSTAISDCINCEIGFYQDQEGSFGCKLCESGTYSDQDGLSKCLLCLAGSYSSREGQTKCRNCLAGEYQNQEGKTKCNGCQYNTYQEGIGSSECLYCPTNSETLTSKSKSAEECFCKLGYYGQPGTNCKQCPDSGICNHFNQHYPNPKPGYWSSLEDPETLTKCSIYKACPGYETNKCNVEIGYTGIRCEECVSGFYKFEKQCSKCLDNSGLRLILILLLAVVCLIILLIIARKGKNYFGSFSILISFLQIVAIFPKFNVVWPYRLIEYLNALSLVNLNIEYLALDCSFEINYTTKWFLIQLIPFVNIFILVIIYYLIALHSKMVQLIGESVLNKFPNMCVKPYIKEQNRFWLPFQYLRFYFMEFFIQSWSKRELKKIKNTCINVFFASLFILYLILCFKILELFNCDYSEKSKKYLLVANLNYFCYDKWWYRMLIFVIIFGLLYIIGIPLFFIWVFWSSAKTIKEKIFLQRFGLLCNRYRKELFFWELFIMARKVLLVICQSILYYNPIFQLVFAIVVICLSIVLQYIYNPYNTKTRNNYEFGLLLVILFILFSGLVLNNKEKDNYNKTIVDIIIFLLFFNIALFFLISIVEIKSRIELKKRQSKIKKKNKFLNSIERTKQDPIIQFLQNKPNFLLMLHYFSKISKSKRKKTIKFYNSLKIFLKSSNNPESRSFNNNNLINKEFRSRLYNVWNDDILLVLLKWYHFKTNNYWKLEFDTLVKTFLLYQVKHKRGNEN
ncbi:insulin-like growth factor binding proteinn-terminal [Anaeramoeba flamelloides]|uniref:Insulin-like growth factor binding proteinn-terminal n=1 Tax=Anaeramoeba flamelloides TaxID=1746091 RepID=A0AAV7Z3G3_9EUKA|nr:insulin-like growth factor binding proteinn-terminal [Anaeramoeba flamelloides]